MPRSRVPRHVPPAILRYARDRSLLHVVEVQSRRVLVRLRRSLSCGTPHEQTHDDRERQKNTNSHTARYRWRVLDRNRHNNDQAGHEEIFHVVRRCPIHDPPLFCSSTTTEARRDNSRCLRLRSRQQTPLSPKREVSTTSFSSEILHCLASLQKNRADSNRSKIRPKPVRLFNMLNPTYERWTRDGKPFRPKLEVTRKQ